MAIYSFGLEGLVGLWRFFRGMKVLSVVLDEHWTVFLERRERLKGMVEGLLEQARNDVPELAGLEEVRVEVVRGEDVGVGEKGLEVGLEARNS